jgi:C4-dicarboxylate-specific signal transduction histidine kinase
MSMQNGGANGGSQGGDGSDRPDSGAPSDRSLRLDDLVYINRMTTVGHVLPSVAHELNNALQVIGGLVELLGMRIDLAPEVSDKIQKIGVQAHRSAGMIREFVAFGRRDETTTRVELQKALDQAIGMRRYHLSRARVDVVVQQTDLAAPLSVYADSHAVLQVLLNLIINAEESLSQAPLGQRELRFVLEASGDRAICEVRDSGPGFPTEARPQIGQPFFSTKTKGAAGLGLAVSQALVAHDQGQLELLDGPGGRVRVQWRLAN